MSVRAKFHVTSKTVPRIINQYLTDVGKSGEREVVDVHLAPVTSGSEENKDFYASTPGGLLVLSTVNKAASDQFEVGKEYYVDFTKVEKVLDTNE